jgi:hypothetical protein
MLENYQSCRQLQHTQLNARTQQLQQTNCTWLLQGEELKWAAVCWRWRFIAVQRNQLLYCTAVCCWIGSLTAVYSETWTVRDIKVRIDMHLDLYWTQRYDIYNSRYGGRRQVLANYIVRKKPKHCSGYMTNMGTWWWIIG